MTKIIKLGCPVRIECIRNISILSNYAWLVAHIKDQTYDTLMWLGKGKTSGCESLTYKFYTKEGYEFVVQLFTDEDGV